MKRCLCVFVLILLTGCCGFNREWKRAATGLPPGDALAGRWDGHWMSERNGHNGRLRCIVRPSTNGFYGARFHAKYWKILTFEYAVPLRAQLSNGVARFEGEADLGRLAGGVYKYNGAVTGTNWQSTYRSRYDHGFFRMNRAP